MQSIDSLLFEECFWQQTLLVSFFKKFLFCFGKIETMAEMGLVVGWSYSGFRISNNYGIITFYNREYVMVLSEMCLQNESSWNCAVSECSGAFLSQKTENYSELFPLFLFISRSGTLIIFFPWKQRKINWNPSVRENEKKIPSMEKLIGFWNCWNLISELIEKSGTEKSWEDRESENPEWQIPNYWNQISI